ncbi:hypothetical protein BGZ76_005856, partial [Entomortierella beljakovae]
MILPPEKEKTKHGDPTRTRCTTFQKCQKNLEVGHTPEEIDQLPLSPEHKRHLKQTHAYTKLSLECPMTKLTAVFVREPTGDHKYVCFCGQKFLSTIVITQHFKGALAANLHPCNANRDLSGALHYLQNPTEALPLSHENSSSYDVIKVEEVEKVEKIEKVEKVEAVEAVEEVEEVEAVEAVEAVEEVEDVDLAGYSNSAPVSNGTVDSLTPSHNTYGSKHYAGDEYKRQYELSNAQLERSISRVNTTIPMIQNNITNIQHNITGIQYTISSIHSQQLQQQNRLINMSYEFSGQNDLQKRQSEQQSEQSKKMRKLQEKLQEHEERQTKFQEETSERLQKQEKLINLLFERMEKVKP